MSTVVLTLGKVFKYSETFCLSTDFRRSLGKDVYIFSSPGLHAVHGNVLKRGVQPAKSQKIAYLYIAIACLNEEGEGIRKKGPDRDCPCSSSPYGSHPRGIAVPRTP